MGRRRAPRFGPRLEHENRPEVLLPVSLAGEVRTPHLGDARLVEKTFLAKAALVEQALGPGAERAAKPLADRRAETHLRTVDQFARDVAVQQGAQQPFAGALFHLHQTS